MLKLSKLDMPPKSFFPVLVQKSHALPVKCVLRMRELFVFIRIIHKLIRDLFSPLFSVHLPLKPAVLPIESTTVL